MACPERIRFGGRVDFMSESFSGDSEEMVYHGASVATKFNHQLLFYFPVLVTVALGVNCSLLWDSSLPSEGYIKYVGIQD